jgi:assimilatory nitrate reductase catalytic subunit
MTQITKSTCPYCGTGCGVLIHHDAGHITGVEGDPSHPANFGRLCTKGATLHLTTTRTGRALYPTRFVRDAAGTRGAAERIGWDAALAEAAERFAAIIERHGPDAVAFYVSGQLLTEDYFVFNKLARVLVGTNNVDSNSRLCMSSAVSAYKRTLGADAPPCSYEDLDHADLVLVAGANPAWAHPILFRRLTDARERNPQQKLIVVDPRVTDTAACADLHLQIEPGTDAILFGAMLHVLLWEGLTDGRFIGAHTEGFDAAREAVRELTPAAAAARCGVKAEDIVRASRWFGKAGAALSLWCQGLNQSHHGSDNGAALIHLHLATGQIGRAGAGPFSLTGQPNAMGGRESGTMATLLPGHRDPADADDRAELAARWAVPALPAAPGRTATEIIDGLAEGSIKAVWIACTNPAQSLPDQHRVREALARAEYVVLQEAYADTETAPFADLLLPAASWGEKEGSVTNSERRISRVNAAVAAPGEARPDWSIAQAFARALARQLGRGTLLEGFGWASTAEVFAEHAALTAGRDLDFAALDYATLERAGPQQWPFRNGQGTARLYGDGRFATADGRARFVPIRFVATAEPTSARYPLHLNTGRLRDQWHGMSRTGRLARLYNHTEGCTIALAPGDMARRGIAGGELLRIASARGEVVLPAAADPSLKSGHAAIPMHWGRRRLSHSAANELLAAVVDPLSKQPELKHAAIRVEPAKLGWQGIVQVAVADGEAALALDAALASQLAHFDYGALSLTGRDAPVVTLRLAHREPPAASLLETLLASVGLADGAAEAGASGVMAFADAARRVAKRACIKDGRLAALAFFGEAAAAGWLREAMLAGDPVADFRRYLFAPLAKPPVARPPRGRIVCNCLDVAETDIEQAIADGAGSLEALQARLGAGTKCGGCLPELRRRLAAGEQTQVAV